METQNLWPDFAIEATRSPKTILKEQAGYLMAKTKNVLSASVVTSQNNDKLTHDFYVVAPALKNYRYKLFSVEQGVRLYPVSIQWDADDAIPWEWQQDPIMNEAKLTETLQKIFTAQSTAEIITSLISQSVE